MKPYSEDLKMNVDKLQRLLGGEIKERNEVKNEEIIQHQDRFIDWYTKNIGKLEDAESNLGRLMLLENKLLLENKTNKELFINPEQAANEIENIGLKRILEDEEYLNNNNVYYWALQCFSKYAKYLSKSSTQYIEDIFKESENVKIRFSSDSEDEKFKAYDQYKNEPFLWRNHGEDQKFKVGETIILLVRSPHYKSIWLLASIKKITEVIDKNKDGIGYKTEDLTEYNHLIDRTIIGFKKTFQQSIILLKNHLNKLSIEETIATDGFDFFNYDMELKMERSSTNEGSFEGLPKQIIHFGAPGTGKSFNLNKNSKVFIGNVKRVTFHSNTMYGNFVGSFKPFPLSDDKTKIKYDFIPGALIKSLAAALLNPEQSYLLIIEEINRANTAAVFGDTFQLLDRNAQGTSEYPIEIGEELSLFINEMIFMNPNVPDIRKKEISLLLKDGLIFPENLYIWSTMNSADQGVLPLDTAFKRRWNFKYYSVDDAFDQEKFSSYYSVNLPDNCFIEWNDIRNYINDALSFMKVPEDKLLGPYFISESTLMKSNEAVTEEFMNKVLMYLFTDVGRHIGNNLFDIADVRLSVVLEDFKNKGITVFKNSEQLNDKVKKKSKLNED